MRARLFPSWVLLALVMVSGAWAQPAPAIDRVDVGSIATLQRQAENGDAKAEFDLGSAYRNGHGVPQDYATAHMWFNLAAASGDKDALENRDLIASKMTPGQIAEAQRLARDWKPNGF